MNRKTLGWLKIIGAGATSAGIVVAAAPLSGVTFVLARIAFLTGMGTTASALYQDKPAKADKRGQVADPEEPR